MTVEELKKRFAEGEGKMIFTPPMPVGALYQSETVGYYVLVVAPGETELVSYRGKHMRGIWYNQPLYRVA